MGKSYSMGGAKAAMRSYYSHYCEVPSSTTMIYEGILNATYFKFNTKKKRKQLI